MAGNISGINAWYSNKIILGPIYRGMPRMESPRISTAIEIAQQCTCSNLRKAARAIALIYDQALRFIVIC